MPLPRPEIISRCQNSVHNRIYCSGNICGHGTIHCKCQKQSMGRILVSSVRFEILSRSLSLLFCIRARADPCSFKLHVTEGDYYDFIVISSPLNEFRSAKMMHGSCPEMCPVNSVDFPSAICRRRRYFDSYVKIPKFVEVRGYVEENPIL